MILEEEYKKRRSLLSKEMKNNSIAILLSAEQKVRSNDTEYPYRQNSNFYYLTGFKEDSSALVLFKTKTETISYLFVHKKDKSKELWTGKRLGVKGAKKLFDIDKIEIIDDLEKLFLDLAKLSKRVYFDFNEKSKSLEKYLTLCNAMQEHKNINNIVGQQRLIKSDSEVALIKKAISITQEAHHNAMKACRELSYEYELQAVIEYVFKKNAAYSDAYTSIVACGNSANTLHYISNNKKLIRGNLILIDAGCEYEYYSSDITRTIPVSGKFSEAQKDIYKLVLSVEQKIIKMIKPGVLRSDLQKKSEKLLCKGMIELGILKGKKKKLLKDNSHKKYYPHGIGHWMGIDVHDECPYKTKKGMEIPLISGMVMTIEPGIYIDKSDTSVPKKYRGIGIRIEDDLLVTDEGYENLSSNIKKSLEDIEN